MAVYFLSRVEGQAREEIRRRILDNPNTIEMIRKEYKRTGDIGHPLLISLKDKISAELATQKDFRNLDSRLIEKYIEDEVIKHLRSSSSLKIQRKKNRTRSSRRISPARHRRINPILKATAIVLIVLATIGFMTETNIGRILESAQKRLSGTITTTDLNVHGVVTEENRKARAKEMKSAGYIGTAEEVDYKELKKRPQFYSSKIVQLYGRIYNIQEVEGRTLLTLSVVRNNEVSYGEEAIILFPGGSALNEGDHIRVYGKMLGNYANHGTEVHSYLKVKESAIYLTENSFINQAPIIVARFLEDDLGHFYGR